MTRVLLQHEYAQAFFGTASRPDLEELRRRDRFFEHIAQETPYYDDDGDLVTEIPDIDVKLLMGIEIQHQESGFMGRKTLRKDCVIHYRFCPNVKSSIIWGDVCRQSKNEGRYVICAV